MAMPVSGMKMEELAKENKALQAKKAEILERQAVIGEEVRRRRLLERVERVANNVMGQSEEEIDALETAIGRIKARRAKERAQQEHSRGAPRTGGKPASGKG